MRQVPYTKVAGIPPEAQRQLQRDFEAAARFMTEGGSLIVPYTKIAGLPPEAQRQIQRNFEDLACDCASTVSPGTILTSDTFTRTASGLLGVSDAGLGGSPKPWSALAGVWETAAGKAQHPTAIGPTTFDTAVVDTAVVDVETKCVVTATGSTVAAAGVTARQTGNTNYYTFYLYRSGGAVYQLYLSKLIAGVETVLAGPVTPAGLIPGNTLQLKLTCTGSSIVGTTGTDTLSATDTTHTTGTFQGLFSIKAAVCDWDSFVVTAT